MEPLYIVSEIFLITCILDFIGLYECINWKLLLRSFFTIGFISVKNDK